jgi:ribosomal protein S18 acetylase RimI-like enzyme
MSMDSMRVAAPPDVPLLTQLVNAAYRPDCGTAGWTHESGLVAGERVHAHQVTALISKADSVVLLGLRGPEVVACVHVEKDGHRAHIGMLAVKPELQRAGFGKQMLAGAEDHARKVWGSEKFSMTVLSSRPELFSFYLRRGYRKTGTILDYPLGAGTGAPKNAGLTMEVLEK